MINNDFLILNEDSVQYNLLLRVRKKGEYVYETLCEAGRSWRDTQGMLEVILEAETGIEVKVKDMNQKTDKTFYMEFEGLEARPDSTSRIQICARALNANEFLIEATDMGFGQIFPSTNKTFQDKICISQ